MLDCWPGVRLYYYFNNNKHGTRVMVLLLHGPRLAVFRALSIIQERGPALGLFINAAKCKLFSLSDLSMFPSMMKTSHQPHYEIPGAPIGDAIFCLCPRNAQWPPVAHTVGGGWYCGLSIELYRAKIVLHGRYNFRNQNCTAGVTGVRVPRRTRPAGLGLLGY